MKKVGSTGVQGFLVALCIHALGIGGLFVISPAGRTRASVHTPVKVRVVSRPEPRPVAAPATEPELKEPIVVEPKKTLRKKVAVVKKAPVVESTTTPALVPPPGKTTPRKFIVAMEATVPGGSVAVPASSSGGWAFGTPAGDSEGEKVLTGPEPAPVEKKGPPAAREAAGVSRLPRLIFQPSTLEMRAAYPEAARREGLEANVYLKILVNADGKVDQERVVRGAGQGFDQAAVDLVKQFRFRPAEADGHPVSVWIPWTYKFRLEG